MGIDWEHGERRYLYTDEEAAFARLPVLTRSFAAELLKFTGRDGVIPVGREPAIDVVCRLVGAHVGERRQIRTIVPQLIADGFLTAFPGALVVRNFITVHYRRDPEKFDAMTVAQRTHLAALRAEFEAAARPMKPTPRQLEPGPVATPLTHESGSSRARTEHEPSTSQDRVEHESVTSSDLSTRNIETHVEPSGPVRSGPKDNPLSPPATGVRESLFALTTIEIRPVTKAERVRQVFDAWVHFLDKPRSQLDTKRRALIEARLDDGYSVSALVKAMEGCAASTYHMGKNDLGRRYDKLTLILRDAEHIEQFIAYADGDETQPIRHDLDDWGDAANG